MIFIKHGHLWVMWLGLGSVRVLVFPKERTNGVYSVARIACECMPSVLVKTHRQ